ncbi:molybdopterin-dependent oxidoreductase [Mycolicibacterium aubagnense]
MSLSGKEPKAAMSLSGEEPKAAMSPSGLRGTAVTARVGVMLGIAVTVCFLTGLISHLIQHPQPWFFWPAHPVWLYRVTQGLHVCSGIAAIPLTVVKLWSVWPKLFERPIIGGVTRQLERLSILVLVGAILFELSTGLLNIAQWYVFRFFFTTTHYAVAYLAAGAVLVHIAVKLPTIRRALGEPLDGVAAGGAVGPTRRTVLLGTGLAVAVATLATAGQTVPWLRQVSALAPRTGKGPQGIPVNRSAVAAGVLQAAASPQYRLTVTNGATSRSFSVSDLRALPQRTFHLPIACVEGWSADAEWTGVVLADLIAMVGGSPQADVRMVSLEPPGPYSRTVLPARHARDGQTLIALELNGETLHPDHGYPCRLIAPSRPGVLQTKWLSRIEVMQ